METATATAARQTLQEQGFTGRALDLLVHAGGPARHAARVETAKIVAYKATNEAGEKSPLPLEAAAVLLAELAGTGGRWGAGLGTPSTDRLRPFRGLGAGRRHAADGPAWDAALLDAARELYRDATGSSPMGQMLIGAFTDSDGDSGIAVYDMGRPAPTFPSLYLVVQDDPDNPGRPWHSPALPLFASLARRGLLATASGVPQNVASSATFFSDRAAMVSGEAHAWAAILNAAEIA